MSRYAERTTVSSIQSRAEIEHTLSRYGAIQFVYGWYESSALIAFYARGRHIRFLLPMPSKDDKKYIHDGRGMVRSLRQQNEMYEQDVRTRWRALALSIKAKLEAVSIGITQFEEEFYANIVLPGGRTIYEETRADVAIAYETGSTPPLLPNVK